MNRIFVTGDTHGDFRRFTSNNFKNGKDLDKSDFMIITGDFGGIWDVNQSGPQEKHWLNWLDEKPWTTLFVSGNHENFDRLDKFPLIDMFGSKVGKINNSIFHLRRGEIYNIAGRNIFTFGGGYSIDKARRTEFISWWKQEQPSNEEYKKGLKTLKAANNTVDYIITHTAPEIMFNKLGEVFWMEEKIPGEEQLRAYFDMLITNINYKQWFCGHFHKDWSVNKFNFLYFNIEELNNVPKR